MERETHRRKYWAPAAAAVLALLAVFLPVNWLDRSLVEVPESPLPPESVVTFVRAALALNALLLAAWWISYRRRPEAEEEDRPALLASTPPREPINNGEALILTLLIVVAAALRFWKLGGDLWFDEVIDLVYYVRTLTTDLLLRFPGFFPQVVSALSAKLSIAFWGESSWSFRLPAAVYGVLGVPALYALVRRAVGRFEALLCAALLAVAYHHIFFSQNARGYSLQVLLTILATYYLWRAAATHARRDWAWFIAMSVLNLYNQVFSLFVLAGLAAAFLGQWMWRWRQTGRAPCGLRRFMWAHLFIGSFSFLLYSPMMVGLLVRAGITAPNPGSGPQFAQGFLNELLQGLQAGYGTVAIIGGLVIFLAGVFRLWKKSGFLAAALLLPLAVGLGTVMAGGIGSHPRYFLYTLPAGLVVIVSGIVAWAEIGARVLRLPQRDTVVRWAAVALVVAGMGVSLWKLVPYYRIPKQDFTGALRFAEASRQPDESLVATGLAAHAYSIYYHPGIKIVSTVEELERLRMEGERVWLLYTLPHALREQNPEMMQYIEQNFEVVRRFPGTVYQASLYVCRAEPTGPVARGEPPGSENH